MNLQCATCGKRVSSEIQDHTIVRAWIECPECIEAKPTIEDLIEEAEKSNDAWNLGPTTLLEKYLKKFEG